MTRKSASWEGIPPTVRDALVRIGEHVRLARRRRGITQADMAARMFVTRKTLSRLERGERGVSLTVLASALWVLGLDRDLLDIASPDRDTVGVHREQQRLPQRVRRSRTDDHLDF